MSEANATDSPLVELAKKRAIQFLKSQMEAALSLPPGDRRDWEVLKIKTELHKLNYYKPDSTKNELETLSAKRRDLKLERASWEPSPYEGALKALAGEVRRRELDSEIEHLEVLIKIIENSLPALSQNRMRRNKSELKSVPEPPKEPRFRSKVPEYIYDSLKKNKKWVLTSGKAYQIAEKYEIDITTELANKQHWNNCQQAEVRARKRLNLPPKKAKEKPRLTQATDFTIS